MIQLPDFQWKSVLKDDVLTRTYKACPTKVHEACDDVDHGAIPTALLEALAAATRLHKVHESTASMPQNYTMLGLYTTLKLSKETERQKDLVQVTHASKMSLDGGFGERMKKVLEEEFDHIAGYIDELCASEMMEDSRKDALAGCVGVFDTVDRTCVFLFVFQQLISFVMDGWSFHMFLLLWIEVEDHAGEVAQRFQGRLHHGIGHQVRRRVRV